MQPEEPHNIGGKARGPSSPEMHSVSSNHHLSELDLGVAMDCGTCYSVLDEVFEQITEAIAELDFAQVKYHDDIRQALTDLECVVKVKRLVRDLIDPRDGEE